MDSLNIIEQTRQWIASVVIGLNLCPFARRVFEEGKIRYAVTEACDEESLLAALASELEDLASCPAARTETTLLIHPLVLRDFPDYNDFVGCGERLLGKLGLRGTIQIATFHPRYQFAGTEPDAVENYTNRSPYPMLHLLREESISRAALASGALFDIPQRNIETLRSLGIEKVLERLRLDRDR